MSSKVQKSGQNLNTRPSTRAQGRESEEFIARWLQQKGFQLLARNFRPNFSSTIGEIDILAQKDSEIFLFEVKCKAPISGVPPLHPTQLYRLQRARRLCCAIFHRPYVRLVLIWINPLSRRVEFLENPC